MSKAAARAAKNARKQEGRAAADYALEPVVKTLYQLVGIRNTILAAPNVAAVLTHEQRVALGAPRGEQDGI